MIRRVFDYAIRGRRLSVHVTRMMALPTRGDQARAAPVQPERLGRLVMAVPPRCQPVVVFLGTTGCRFWEMAALRVNNVVQTPHGLGAWVHRAATQSEKTSEAVFGPTKNHQTRTVPVPAALDDCVRRRVAGASPGEYRGPSTTPRCHTRPEYCLGGRPDVGAWGRPAACPGQSVSK